MKDSSFQFYSRSKIVSGNRALEGIPLELAGYNRKRPFVLTGKGECSKNSTGRFRDAICDSGMEIPAFWDGVVSGDDMTLARELAAIFMLRNCDSLIAIGGGNTLKMSRHINMIVNGDKDYSPLFLVPTAAIHDTDFQITSEPGSVMAQPDVIFIDSSIKKPESENSYINASLTAFARAVEGYFGMINPLSDSFRSSAVSLLYGNVISFLGNPGNAAARTAVINGIIHGGIALGNSETGIVHHLGESIGRENDVEPGVLMLTLLPRVLEYRIKDGQNCDQLLKALAGIDKYCSVKAKDRPGEVLSLTGKFVTTALNLIPARMREIHVQENSLKNALAYASESTGMPAKKLAEIVSSSGIKAGRGGRI